MIKLLLQKLISLFLVLNILTPATISAYGLVETSQPVQSIETNQVVELTQTYRWIDRIDWTEETSYALDFYKTLENESEGGKALIDVSKGHKDKDIYYLPITTINGIAASENEAANKANEKAAIIAENISVVYKAFERDHPEVFWLSTTIRCSSNITYNQYTKEFKANILFILKDSEFDIREKEYQSIKSIESAIKLRDSLTSSIIKSAPSNNRYEQLKYFNSYLVEHNQYNKSIDLYSLGKDCYECISALKGSSGTEGPTCEGYSNAFKVLCDQAGIPCILITGYTGLLKDAGYHIWNYVQMEDGNWYAVDVTWNDSFIKNNEMNTAWLLVGSETVFGNTPFNRVHIISTTKLDREFKGWPELSKEAYIPQYPA